MFEREVVTQTEVLQPGLLEIFFSFLPNDVSVYFVLILSWLNFN